MKKLILILIVASATMSQEFWQIKPSVTTKKLKRLQFVDTSYGWACGDSGIIIHTSNGGNNWIVQNSQITNFAIDDIFFLNRNLGWGIANDFFYFGTKMLKTTNGGANWEISVYPDTTIVLNTIYFLNSLTGFLSGYSGFVYKTTDGGNNWSQCRVDTAYCQWLYLFPKVNFNFYNAQTGFVCGGQIDIQGIVWKTTDAGLNWFTHCITPEPLNRVVPLSPYKIIATGGDFEYGASIAYSRDSGNHNTWIWDAVGPSTDSAFSGIGWALAYRTPSEVWVPLGFGASWGVNLDSGDTEGEWLKIPTPLNRTIYDAQFVTPSFGWAVGDTGYMFKYNTAVIGLSELRQLYPDKFVLYQNFPNPFNPATSISYYLPQKLDVNITVYDILGRVVFTSAVGNKPSGFNTFIFSSAGLASGVYFYRIEAGDWSEARKMVILK